MADAEQSPAETPLDSANATVSLSLVASVAQTVAVPGVAGERVDLVGVQWDMNTTGNIYIVRSRTNKYVFMAAINLVPQKVPVQLEGGESLVIESFGNNTGCLLFFKGS